MDEKNPYKKKFLAITINFDNEHQFYYHNNRMTKWRDFVNDMLLDSLNGLNYCLYPEISTPIGDINCMGPRLHLHGIIHLRNKSKLKYFLIHSLPRLKRHSMIRIDICNDPHLWYNYCTKDKEWFNELPFSNFIESFNLWEKAFSICDLQKDKEPNHLEISI